jgi:predicted DNA-binding transcriptional regulator YafY
MSPFAVLPSLPALGLLQQAIRERAVASFTYRGRPRVVAGYGLVFREGSWYLLGHEEGAGAVRTFRVDRIEGEPRLGEHDSYTPPEGLDVAGELRFSPLSPNDAEGRATEVTLEVDVRAQRSVRQMIGEGALEVEGPEGSVVFSFRAGDDVALLSYVLGLGDAAVVRAPASLAARVVVALEEATRSEAAGAR